MNGEMIANDDQNTKGDSWRLTADSADQREAPHGHDNSGSDG
jgi:hypothetical protein